MSSKLFPLVLDLHNRPVLIAGEGSHALEKIRLLIESGAMVRLYCEPNDPNLDVVRAQVEWRSPPVSALDLDDVFFAVYAGEDRAEAERLFQLAESKRKLFCSVDDPAHCNVIFPAIARSGSVQVAISTSGLSPTLARRLKDQIQKEILGDHMGDFAELLGYCRTNLNPRISGFENKKKFWDRVFDSDVFEILKSKGQEAAYKRVVDLLDLEQLP